ncbi:MAG: hypothetical protein JXC32_03110, partial [Anaerolineae bacterium]|nr:hypothetical protein [Anaerolineae bacterium]
DPDFDPVRTAVLITDDAVTNGGCNATGAPVEAAGEWVRVSGSSENEVVIDLQVLSPGYLVVADAWYPGWSAAIRKLDSPTEVKYEDVVQADLLFRAVPVDAGRWRITLSYSSWGLAWGTAASVVGVLLLWQYARTRRRCCEV